METTPDKTPPRMARPLNRRLFLFILLTPLALVFLLFKSGCLEIETGPQAQEAAKVCEALQERCRSRGKGGTALLPAMSCKGRRDCSELHVYGNHGRAEREEICAEAAAVRREVAQRPIRLFFYPRDHEQTDLIEERMFP